MQNASGATSGATLNGSQCKERQVNSLGATRWAGAGRKVDNM